MYGLRNLQKEDKISLYRVKENTCREIGGRIILEKVIVIGGSIAGKLAAKALSHTFRQVIILEAGERWREKAPCKRVPQSYHPHVLLKGGEEAIVKLFPHFFDQLIEDGSIVNNFTRDLKWHHFGFWKKRFLGELEMVQQSRPMLEWHLQHRIDQIPNIATEYETKAEQLLLDHQHNKISGVRVRSLKTGREKELLANMVVDASGFGSKSVDWLKSFGIEVKEEKVWIQLFYATKLFRLKNQDRPDWCNLLISPSFPENPYGAFIQTIEENRFSVTFSGYANESAPRTNEEFFSYAQKLPVPNVVQFLEQVEPISEIKIHTIPYQVRRRFDLAESRRVS
ncbi:flavin-dependent dehydrogenase [Bacillus sp. V2I10]|nr:flavin-dependent dehydrogenase [Bacillus sp. V2I10]